MARETTISIPAAALNHEAGSHAVTGDPAEIAAATEAAERSWREFPYYERRFAERGRRFCTSDSAWLVTLCSLDRREGLRQILWLGGVLASRGMPRYLLERHLLGLHEALTRAVPRRAKEYRLLEQGARALAGERRAQIDDDAFASLAKQFAGREVERMGELLVAAVADEGAGIGAAVTSIETWACDEALFPRRWIDAVRATVAAARGHRDGIKPSPSRGRRRG